MNIWGHSFILFLFFMDSIYFIKISFIGLRVYLSGQSAWRAGTKPQVSPAAPQKIGNRDTWLNPSTQEMEAGRSKVQGHFWHHSNEVNLIHMRTFISNHQTNSPPQLNQPQQNRTKGQHQRRPGICTLVENLPGKASSPRLALQFKDTRSFVELLVHVYNHIWETEAGVLGVPLWQVQV